MNIGIVAAEDTEMLAIKKLMKEISENKIYNLNFPGISLFLINLRVDSIILFGMFWLFWLCCLVFHQRLSLKNQLP